jgi:hypothetical protein
MSVTIYNVGFVYEETESGIVINIRYKHRYIQTDDSAMTTLDCL